jgi:hypothetical protein
VVVEHFQFGISMFDPLGLKTRYAHLVEWQGGLWVNYYTQTIPRHRQNQSASGEGSRITTQTSTTESLLDNDNALLANGMISSGAGDEHTAPEGTTSQATPQPEDVEKQIKEAEKTKVKEKNKQEKGKHFIVLPRGLGNVLGGVDKWERVIIGGVEDEVSAHTGLFKSDQNPGYEDLLERVEARILGWCENLAKFEGRP